LYVAQSRGLYRYEPAHHELSCAVDHDVRPGICASAPAQDAIVQAAAVFVITAVYARTRDKYLDRARRYVHMEAGHAAQNLLLQAVALGLGGVPVGAFDDQQLHTALQLPANETPLYLIPIGHPR
jgi:SagB-type dehydrogenase family enzyme